MADGTGELLCTIVTEPVLPPKWPSWRTACVEPLHGVLKGPAEAAEVLGNAILPQVATLHAAIWELARY